MKRISLILLSLALLAACVPTPETEFVVNKGDHTAEQKINATPKPQAETDTVKTEPGATQQPVGERRFAARWDEETVTIGERITYSVHADVVQKADGLYPVYRLKDAPLDEDTARALAQMILGRPVEAYTSEATKADIQQEIQDYLDTVEEQQEWVAAGKPDWGDRDETVFTQEEIDAQLAYLKERFNNAPDKLETRPVSDYGGLHRLSETTYTLESGEQAYVSFYSWGFTIHKGCAYYSMLYNEEMYRQDKRDGERNAKLWHEVTMERETAEAILQGELERLGLREYSVVTADRACRCERSRTESLTYKSGGWAFTLKRNPGGYPTTEFNWEPSQYLNYGSGDGFMANKPLKEEELVIFIDENGLQSFSFYNRREIVGMPNANVELLPFEDIRRIAKNMFSACIRRELIGDREAQIEVYAAILTTYPLRVRDSDEIYLMPCWVLLFDGLFGGSEEYRMSERTSRWNTHDALILNAVDGTVVHTDYGY